MNKLLSSGQVSGLLEIPITTLQRYVKQFPEFFSDRARQHNRGRRWTDRDIESIRIIRKGFNRRAGLDAIRVSLTEAAVNPNSDPSGVFEAMEISVLALDASKRGIDEIRRLVKYAGWNNTDYQLAAKQWHENFSKLSQRVYELERRLKNHMETKRHRY